MPIRNVGSEMPASEIAMKALDSTPCRLSAVQFQRGGHAFFKQFADGPALAVRDTEIALHRITDEAGELHHEGIVQAELDTQLRALFRRGVLADHAGDRVAHIAEHGERDQRHRQHHQHRLDKPLRNKGKHYRMPSFADNAGPRFR
ncbi:hypothetical protein G6F65_021838 [Rhizopus arrhizus]|nr:hypothetical protein G6F65_021838 [Rhizopus arrhizus]